MKLTHNQAVIGMVGVTLLWSTAGVVTRQLEFARSFEVTFWRALFTSLTLLIVLPSLHGRQLFVRMLHNGKAFWISGICWCVMFTAYMLALTMTTVANVLITMSLGPLMTAIVARVFIGHRIAPRTWVAIVFAGIGIAYMYGIDVRNGSLLGTMVALCVPIAAATNWTVTQHAQQEGIDVDLVPAVLVGALLSSMLTFPLAYPFRASEHDMLLLGGLGVFQLALPCIFSVACARVLKAPEVSLLALLEVLFGILLAWVGAGEAPTLSVLTGGTLVLGALLINEYVAWRERA